MKIVRLAVATRNSGKLREFRELLSPLHAEVVGLADLRIDSEYEETGDSFAENARLKARCYSIHTELPVLGDDSGLEVSALGGRPGVRSARYGGPDSSDADRIRLLLEEMEGCRGGREARFVCALALARDGVLLAEALGHCRGEIARAPRGDRGFGYDPIFYFPDLKRTYAELETQEKNRVSHRAQAVRKLLEQLSGENHGPAGRP